MMEEYNSPRKQADYLRQQAILFIEAAEAFQKKELTVGDLKYLKTWILKLLHYIAELHWKTASVIEEQTLIVIIPATFIPAEIPDEQKDEHSPQLEQPPFDADWFNRPR